MIKKPREPSREEVRKRLETLGAKAARDPKKLTQAELDEICTLVEKLDRRRLEW